MRSAAREPGLPPHSRREASRKLMELFDLSDPRATDAWHAIDNRVMGGMSRSTLRHDPAGHAVFEGTVSLERNGGFASVRSSPANGDCQAPRPA